MKFPALTNSYSTMFVGMLLTLLTLGSHREGITQSLKAPSTVYERQLTPLLIFSLSTPPPQTTKSSILFVCFSCLFIYCFLVCMPHWSEII